MSVLRWLPRLLIPLAIAAALVIDARDDRTPLSAAVEDPEALTQVVVPPPDALTSSWFCPVVGMRAPVQGFGEVTSEVLLTNMTAEAASVSVEFRGRTTGRQFVTADVAPHSTGVVTTSDYVRDEVIGALVEATSGGLAVTRRLISPLGVDEARCSSILAPNWFVPVGDTQADALGVLAIMNPLPRDAIVDVTFASEAEFGPFVAPALTGVVVPAWSTVAVDVGEHARRRDVVAASVRARTGRIAVDSFVAYDGSVGRRGLAAELASVAAGDRWLVPVAGIDNRTHLWLRVFNPSDGVAEVAASVASHDARSDRVAFAVASHDVMELKVEPPGELAPGLATLLAPAGAPFGIAVESQNGVPIVVWAETLVGSAASPLTDIGAASASVSAAGDAAVPDSGGQSTTVVAQTGGTEGADAPVGDAASDEGDDESPVEIVPPVHRAQSGLAFVPGIVRTSDRWLVVIAPESGGEAFLTIMTDPFAAADGDGSQDGDPSVSTNSDRRVVVGTLGRETVALIDVPASGVVTHWLASGTTRLLVSDTPFAVLLWQARSGSEGLSAAHPLVW
ncbi:hypothetical protein [Candidatus Poriferisodalis sp.]|uniref:hypothetical protein n=1 Tax=Candidatus Poriferisodalis sp. TaxID=3101277 RepID=UPI003B01D589